MLPVPVFSGQVKSLARLALVLESNGHSGTGLRSKYLPARDFEEYLQEAAMAGDLPGEGRAQLARRLDATMLEVVAARQAAETANTQAVLRVLAAALRAELAAVTGRIEAQRPPNGCLVAERGSELESFGSGIGPAPRLPAGGGDEVIAGWSDGQTHPPKKDGWPEVPAFAEPSPFLRSAALAIGAEKRRCLREGYVSEGPSESSVNIEDTEDENLQSALPGLERFYETMAAKAQIKPGAGSSSSWAGIQDGVGQTERQEWLAAVTLKRSDQDEELPAAVDSCGAREGNEHGHTRVWKVLSMARSYRRLSKEKRRRGRLKEMLKCEETVSCVAPLVEAWRTAQTQEIRQVRCWSSNTDDSGYEAGYETDADESELSEWEGSVRQGCMPRHKRKLEALVSKTYLNLTKQMTFATELPGGQAHEAVSYFADHKMLVYNKDPTVVWQERPPISLSNNMSYVYVDGERKPLNTLGIQWKALPEGDNAAMEAGRLLPFFQSQLGRQSAMPHEVG
ncbi:unnamed protein product [Symbiodinium sp. KB8]|nr:unnamed protein product [Symbiodinium sp. KB8]